MRPTLWPSFTRASARLTATVVLPTPPLPLAMATRFLTPGMGWRAGVCCGTGTGGIWIPILQLAEMGRSMLRPYDENRRSNRTARNGRPTHALAPWHFLYFLPEPQGQGSLRPTLAPARTGLGASACAGPV